MNEPNNFFSKIKRYQDGYYWFGLTCVWALFIPMFAKMVMPFFDYTLWKFFSEGDIVLFSMVITSSLVIDNFLFEKDFSAALGEGISEFTRGLFIHISPMLLIVFCLIFYLRCQAVKEHIDTSTIIAEIILFVLVAVYAAFVKQTSWGEKHRNEKDKEEKPSSSIPLNNQT